MQACSRRQALVSPIGVVSLSAVRPRDARAIPMMVDVPEASVSEYMRRRDEAADFKCKGGMMDCDGNRREYAKEQYKTFLQRNEGVLSGTVGDCKGEGACTEDSMAASMNEVEGRTSQERLQR